MKKTRVLALIPTRLGSTRLSSKPLLKIKKIPMIVHTYKRTELSNLKTKLGQRFGGTCYFCGCQWSKKGMTIHHIYYLKKDITYDQFQ